ncbi:zinc ABC transporter substrate-binding protein [Methanosarcina sp. Z-7115]|uniref:Zinc ABC transporter substrate-binding protein n=1 Tax=Methanosarcina baikalica TaxID=3073890 RepID=A0ABU2D4A8_9EURY|nr:zinc ABC transporter substrate-binding protein [Methanosarcina sp. Z-7115]MDR7666687.1 zinc ABC transporter substrate-binding protein [Methanosarcina sp. Z-7115]
MKLKIVSLLVLLAVGLSLFASGCTGPGNSQVNDSTGQEVEAGTDMPITVAVSVLPQAEFVEKVGGNKVKTVVIIPPGADPHTYEPSPRELGEVSEALMYVTLGVDMPFERVWIDRFETINSGTLIVNSSNGIELKKLSAHDHHEGEGEEEHAGELEADRANESKETHENESKETHANESEETHENESEEGREEIELDPHIWTSPSNAKIMVENIYKGLVEIDPGNETYYSQNRDAYLKELDALDARIREKLEGREERNFMVYHPSWGYFAADYNLTMIPVEIEGKEPSAQDLAKLVDLAKEKHVKVIFVQSEFNTRSAQAIAEEIGGEVVVVDPLAKDYIANMDKVSDIFARNLV